MKKIVPWTNVQLETTSGAGIVNESDNEYEELCYVLPGLVPDGIGKESMYIFSFA